MKKIIFVSLIIITILIVTLWPSKTKNTNLTPITLAEVTHSVFYTPLYVAIENDYFKKEGIEINLLLTPGADKVSAAVLSNDAQIGLAGAESAIYILKEGQKDYLQIFSGLTKRDGQFLMGRSKDNQFNLEDLKGKEILVGRQTGMPALNFLNALKNSNIDPNDININYSVDFASLSGTIIGGTGDFVNLFEPNATLLEKEGYGYSLLSIGKLSGEMPYTTFYAKQSYINNNKELLRKFINAINEGLKYTMNHDSKDIAKIIINQFPNTDINDLTKNIERYKESDSWLNNYYVQEELFTNLENLLIDNNLLDKYVDYNKIFIDLYA